MKWRTQAAVEAVTRERLEAQELRVFVEGNETRRALNYTALTGPAQVGDQVLLNTVAVELGLGTGGMDFVVANLSRALPDAAAPGHILKLRYTPLQTPVLAVEAPESPHHNALRNFDSLKGLPVVCLELHSQLPAACAGAKWALERLGFSSARVVYVMTEGAALPLALSRTVPELKAKRLLDTTITAGQAFGGDIEAVTLYSAMAAARVAAGADVVIVGQGPGNAGTGTPLGFSGIDQGLAVNAAYSLGGMPIVAPRLSFADGRKRHQGVSHHTLTVLSRIALAPAFVVLPRLSDVETAAILTELAAPEIVSRHVLVSIDASAALDYLTQTGLQVTTMGRGIEQERAFFLAAAAAGVVAGQLASHNRP